MVVLSCNVQRWGESLNPIGQIVVVLNGRLATSRFLNPKFEVSLFFTKNSLTWEVKCEN